MLLAYLAYIAIRSLNDYEYWTIFSGLTLIVHEAGHVIFSPFGELIEVMGGSFTQLAVPVVVATLFLRQREYFGIAVVLAWLSLSLANLSTYIGDAWDQILPLVSMGSGDPIHDWHYILGHFGMLGDTRALARFTTSLAVLSLIVALGLGAWLCNAMRVSPAAPPSAGEELARG